MPRVKWVRREQMLVGCVTKRLGNVAPLNVLQSCILNCDQIKLLGMCGNLLCSCVLVDHS